jgi:hypothetical protein
VIPLEETLEVLREIADGIDGVASLVADEDEAARWWREALNELSLATGWRYERLFAQTELVEAANDRMVVVCANELVRAQMGRLNGQLSQRLARIAGRDVSISFVLPAAELQEAAA